MPIQKRIFDETNDFDFDIIKIWIVILLVNFVDFKISKYSLLFYVIIVDSFQSCHNS